MNIDATPHQQEVLVVGVDGPEPPSPFPVRWVEHRSGCSDYRSPPTIRPSRSSNTRSAIAVGAGS